MKNSSNFRQIYIHVDVIYKKFDRLGYDILNNLYNFDHFSRLKVILNLNSESLISSSLALLDSRQVSSYGYYR